VLDPMGRIVLVEQWNNSWTFPKGGVEEGESNLDAAQREVREETGIQDFEYIYELGSYERKSIAPGGVGETDAYGSRKRTFFLFKTIRTDLVPADPDGEITAIRWVTIEEALALLTHPRDKEFLESVRGKIEGAILQQ